MGVGTAHSLKTLWVSASESLSPGYFAFVMATGIGSVAAHLHGFETIAKSLLWLNSVAYLVLCSLTLTRFALFRAQVNEDLTHHARGTAFLTKVAGTCVLGCQFALLTPWSAVAEALWFLGLALWAVLSYTFLASMTIRAPKPALDTGISGGWLLLVVAAESVCILGSLVAVFMVSTEAVLLVSLAMYFVGTMLYAVFTTLILYRWMFFGIRPADFTPDYWINMGAAAITALAGASLLQSGGRWPVLQHLGGFLTGSALLFWAVSTWWIPLLVVLECWRHVWRGVPARYTPDAWSLVFPLGMYAAVTSTLAKLAGLASLNPIGGVFVYVALVAWGATFAGMVRSVLRAVRPTEFPQPGNGQSDGW